MGYQNSLSPIFLRQIYAEVALLNQEHPVGSPGRLRDGIFELLERVGTLIIHPFDDEEFWGIYVNKDERHYFVLNSAIPLEKQVFAGARELAHTLNFARVKFDVFTAEIFTQWQDARFCIETPRANMAANRFAMELLVGKRQLRERYEELPKAYSTLIKAVLLSDYFLVPYKVIVNRLAETGIVKDTELDQLLSADTAAIEGVAQRFECCRRNFTVTREQRLGGYINKALLLYENELSTYNELSSRLKLINKRPQDFGKFDDDIYEFLHRAAEVGERYGEDD